MQNRVDDSKNYSSALKRRIAHKTFALMRRSIDRGLKTSQADADEFSEKLALSIPEICRIKVNEIISRAQSLVATAQAREPTLVVAMMHKLLRNIAEHTDVEITAHPACIHHLKKALNDNSQGLSSVRKVIFLEDESFDQGSLVIKANKSIIDAQMHTQFERARTLLLQRLLSKADHGKTN